MQGAFIDFYLEYYDAGTGTGLNADQQAVEMLKACASLVAKGFKGAAITYSANEGQTKALEAAYAAGQYSGHVTGGHQAEPMTQLEDRLGLDWTQLQLKMRIAPITTIPDAGTDWATIVASDLTRIRQYLVDGWAVLGWQNQKSRGTSHPYAIGGGYQKLPAAIATQIQDGLKAMATDFPPP